MLKRTFVYFFVVLIVFIGLFLTKFLYINKKDFEEYNNIAQKKLDFDSDIAYQKRTNVKKDLYVIEKQLRQHYIIFSELSEIFLDKKNQKYELIENLNNITFQCFEDFFKDSSFKHIKYITAKNGNYLFPSHKLKLFDIDMSFINSTNFKNISFENAYFKGKAKELNFAIHKKKPQINVLNFEGFLDPKKNICEK